MDRQPARCRVCRAERLSITTATDLLFLFRRGYRPATSRRGREIDTRRVARLIGSLPPRFTSRPMCLTAGPSG